MVYNPSMDFILLGIIVLQFIYLVYQDHQNRKERNDLHLKLMAKNLTEYKDVTESTTETAPAEEDPYLTLDEAGVDRVVGAKEI
jgi:hypothetical protein